MRIGGDGTEGTPARTAGSLRPMADLDPFRLPTDVTPRRYALELAPDLDAATFAGTADIDVEVHEQVDSVVLNALELDIDEAWITAAGGGRHEGALRLDGKAQ